MTGVDLPSPSSDLDERQLQLKQTATKYVFKLDPALSAHTITYIRVVKTPKPSILEVECETVDGYALHFHFCLLLFSARFKHNLIQTFSTSYSSIYFKS